MDRQAARALKQQASRLKRVRAQLKETDSPPIDGLLLTHNPDQRHLTGFSGEDSFVLLTRKETILVTDSRFDEQAKLETSGVDIRLREKTMSEALAKLLGEMKLKRVGFDASHTTVAVVDGLKKQIEQLKPPSKVELVPITEPLGRIRIVKDDLEIDQIRQAIEVAEESFLEVALQIKAGMTEAHAAGMLVMQMRSRGASDASFEPIVASGANSSMPHYRPKLVEIRNNQPLLFDWGAFVDGYCSDITRTFLPGKCSKKMWKIYEVCLEANLRAIDRIKPGMTGKEADNLARDVIKKAKLGKYFGHSLGHGVGRDIHEAPSLSQLRNDPKKDVIEPGMVVTIEPGIYLPGVGGVRIEDDVRMTNSGCEVLTTLPKDRAFTMNAIAL